MYLGTKHFRMPKDTMRVNRDAANPLSDNELRSLHMPVLLLFGDGEVIYDPAQAFDRARRLIPHFEGELIPAAVMTCVSANLESWTRVSSIS